LYPPPGFEAGALAESWEYTGPDTKVYTIRKGVRFHNKPPANGREMNAHDVVASINHLWDTPTAYHSWGYPRAKNIESVTATDDWTVVFEAKPGRLGMVQEVFDGFANILPTESIELYGLLSDWRNSLGTGPFMLTDYVTDSSITFERNPDYWMNDPLNPGNQLPYIDIAKILIIPDMSTMLSAIRTGKIDQIGAAPPIEWEDAESLISTNPELQYRKGVTGSPQGISVMQNDPNLPFADIRVRQALSMAINRQELVDEFYGGNAALLTFPVVPIPAWVESGFFIPPEDLPDSAREVIEYNPTKARQLLTEAGYPDGFSTTIATWQSFVDLFSVISEYWDDIGVDLELDVREYGAFRGLGGAKSGYEVYGLGGAQGVTVFKFQDTKVGQSMNYGMVNDPVVEQLYDTISEVFFDFPERQRVMKEKIPWFIEQSFVIQLPWPEVYVFWQPWVKGYSGELHAGYARGDNYVKYLWLDLDLKEDLTGMR
jgi:peptide/nickel transport system substrate-binding protein